MGGKSEIISNNGTDVLGACNFNERGDRRRGATALGGKSDSDSDSNSGTDGLGACNFNEMGLERGRDSFGWKI